GDQGVLGTAVTGLQRTADDRAWFVDFQQGAIYWTPQRGALAIHSGNWLKYQENGRHNGPLGLPIAEETPILNGTAVIARYEGGAIYWSPETGLHAVHSGNWVKYQELGGHDGALGLPISDETLIKDGTAVVAYYQHGAVYWSPQTGLH